MRIVGIYASARFEHDGEWTSAAARHCFLIESRLRPELVAWPTGQGMRRWASGGPRRSHPELLGEFLRIKTGVIAGKLIETPVTIYDQVYSGLERTEGQQCQRLITYRFREARLRDDKINEVLRETGRLRCEVPGCGFEFYEKYGEMGRDYAHVHHLIPLSHSRKHGVKTGLKLLKIVCANCHAMIHRGGECRDMASLIPTKFFSVPELPHSPDGSAVRSISRTSAHATVAAVGGRNKNWRPKATVQGPRPPLQTLTPQRGDANAQSFRNLVFRHPF